MASLLTSMDKTRPEDRAESTATGCPALDAVVGKTTLVVDPSGDLGYTFVSRTGLPVEDTLVVSDSDNVAPEVKGITCDSFLSPTSATGASRSNANVLDRPWGRLILFLPPRPSQPAEAIIDRCVGIAARGGGCTTYIVSPASMESGDDEQSTFEESVSTRFANAKVNAIVLRTGIVVDNVRSRNARVRHGARYPLVPGALTSVFLSHDELFSAICRLDTLNPKMHRRHLTLLGLRRPLCDVLKEQCPPGFWTACRIALARLLSWMLVGRLAIFTLNLRQFRSGIPRWCRATLEPATFSELLSLYHPLNWRHVALAGYNTGVTHFGWKYPGRTVVRTTGCGRLVRVGQNSVTVDAGVLLKRLVPELCAKGKELYVLPNYSYISLGTTFMVPVHGSGCGVSTLGETIEQVVVYDPHADCIVRLRRGDERFGRWMYNPSSGVLVLRLRLRIRDKSRYFVKRLRLQSPSAEEILATFADPDASNIELRKSRAGDSSVEVSQYFTTPTEQETLEYPRDSIGRLWDRLEENSVTSWLFHTYVRRHGFHVELFLDKREFELFWRLHSTLPLSKIQLRIVRCDHLSHSPFGDGDRLAADLFMQRRHSAAFLAFMKEHLPHARFNPGKHSL